MDEKYKETRYVLKGNIAFYSPASGKILLSKHYADEPCVVEHELIHLLGEKYVWQGIKPKRLINQHAMFANAITSFLDKEDSHKKHKLGIANSKDFSKIRRYKLIPLEFQENIKDLRITSYRTGNYARELANGDLNKGLQLIYEQMK